MRTLAYFIALFFAVSNQIHAQETVLLYAGEVPGALACARQELRTVNPQNQRVSVKNVVAPTLEVYLPENTGAATAAVIVCPGGGYSNLAYTHEGTDVARAFQKAGVAAFILKYRLPNDSCMADKSTGPLQDAQQAMILVRSQAAKWRIDPAKVGILGFSAGGHLASTAGTHFTMPVAPNPQNINIRPDFMLLIYPVINLTDSLAHKGSRDNLLGKNASPEKIALFSNDLQVTPQTPPTFLVHAADDAGVKAANSLAFAAALQRNKVPMAMVMFQNGGHGFGMINPTTKELWFENALNWMRQNKWLQQ